MPAALSPPSLPASPLQGPASPDTGEWQTCSRALDQSPHQREVTLAVEGMHCAACTLIVEQALLQSPGVVSAEVNGATATAHVVWTPAQGGPDGWLAHLRRAGYTAAPVQGLSGAEQARDAQRLLLWRWLVAGFCMMQVMMYAVPAYVAAPGDITPDMVALLRWASWTLTLPVVLFACWPFFQAALRDLRHRRLGMDVPVALGIVVAFGASAAATLDPTGPWGHEVWYDSVTMFVFFLLSGRLLEQRLRNRTSGALQALMRRLPAKAERLLPNGAVEQVLVSALAVGDQIRVRPGDVFPVDGTVTQGTGHVHEALLTGESRPLRRTVGDAVVAASHNLDGTLQVRVDQTGNGTRYAAIVALMAQAAVQRPPLARLADRLASPFLALVLLASAGAAAWWWSTDPAHAVSVAVAVLIVTCPCALSLATPAASVAAAGALARRGVLVRQLAALETCANVDTVVFDKTGTLTEDRMCAHLAAVRPGANAADVQALAGALAACSQHPAARAVASLATTDLGQAEAVLETAGQGIAGDVVVAGQRHPLRLGSAAFCDAPPHLPTAHALQVHLADEAGWLARFDIEEVLRPDAARTVVALQAMGLRVQLLSGDQPNAVRRLAERAGITEAWAQQSPDNKLAHVQALQAAGHRVAMVGDGLNDGPVLACADVSVAMGDAVPLAQAQADVVVLGPQLDAVRALLLHGRQTHRVVAQNLFWAAAYNLVCVPLAVAGALPPWLAGLGMAASSLGVVVNATRLAQVSTAKEPG